MANEKMNILKMLEEGRITSAEAARLLESVGQPGAPAPPPMSGSDNRSNNPGGSHSAYSTGPSRSPEGLSGDLSRRFEAFAKDLEPKLQKFTETVAEKIVSGADKLSKTLTAESPSGGPAPAPRPANPGYTAEPRRPAPAPVPAPASVSGFEKNIEMAVGTGYNELNLSGLNGDVRVKGYNGDKITARVSWKPKRNGAVIDLMKLGGKYYLNYEEDDFERVSVDAYVPERLFQVVNISCLNGNLDVSSVSAREMRFTNANGQTRLAELAAENIKADCSTGRLTLSSIASENAIIENFNGNVDCSELDIAQLSLTNYNGGLTLLMSSFARYEEYLWAVETSNAKLSMNLPTLPELGYHIKAHTTLGEIRLGLTGMQFLINEPSLTEARSVYFDRSAKKVKLTAETSNAPLMIN